MNRTFLLFLATVLLAMGLVGCSAFGGGEEAQEGGDTAVVSPETAADVPMSGILGSDQPLGGQGVLVCSSACSDRAQCGDLNNQTPVVLISRNGPAADGHDTFAAQGITADILEMQTVTMQNSATGEQFPANFYRIRTAEIDSGWVAGWCIQK